MRDRQIITITDYRGSRHYTLSQLMKRVLLGVGAGLGLIVLTGSLVLYVMTHKVSELKDELGTLHQNHSDIESRNELLLAEQQRLLDAVRAKSDELNVLSDEVGQIEVMIGLKPGTEVDLHERIDTASQTAMEKRLMLASIPSGYPVPKKGITSRFGMRQHPVRGKEAFHWGVDLKAQRGTAVYATAEGVVEWAAMNKGSGLGKMVKLNHNYGFSTIYGHLDKIEAKSGQYVRKGDLLGYSGSTGVTSGPHLHYEVRYLQRRLNPTPFMSWSLDNYDSLFTQEERVQWESLAEVVRRTANNVNSAAAEEQPVPEQLLSQQAHASLGASP
jgi:hypothetical protein